MEGMTIIDNPNIGIIQVKYAGITLVEVLYCEDNGDDESAKYLTHDSALEMAKRIGRSLYAYNPVQSTKGISLYPKYVSIQEV